MDALHIGGVLSNGNSVARGTGGEARTHGRPWSDDRSTLQPGFGRPDGQSAVPVRDARVLLRKRSRRRHARTAAVVRLWSWTRISRPRKTLRVQPIQEQSPNTIAVAHLTCRDGRLLCPIPREWLGIDSPSAIVTNGDAEAHLQRPGGRRRPATGSLK